MVNQFVRQTGGAMHIASTVGAGTTVTLYLPRSTMADVEDVAVGETPPEDASARSDKRILVVEDDPMVRNNVVTMLTDMGYDVTEANNGADALAMLENGTDCDLVFSDIALPGPFDGRDLAQEIVKRDRGIKVLLTTGVPDHAQDAELEHSGIPVLAKPYRYDELSQAIRSMWSV
jgi:CheY-like chemotaxis protein